MSYTPVEKRNSAGAGIPAKPVSVGGYVPVSSRSSSSVADYIPVEQRPDGFVPLQTVKTPEPVVETPKKPGIISKIASLPGKAIKGAGNLLAKTYGPNIEAGLAMQDETGADKVLKKVASLVGGASPENLPLGVGEVVKGYKDVFNNPNDYSEFTLEDVLKGIVDTAKEVEKIPFKAVSNLALKPVKFNLPVLGEVTNRQYDATRRINNGENPVAVAAEEGINSIFDTLFLAGLANEVAGPRHVVSGNMKNVDMKTIDAKTGNPTTTSVPSELLNTPGPKNFKLYQNPTTQNTRLISPETVKLMIEQEKITPNANFNPKLPTYFKGSFKPNGNFVGEVIQVKPSWVSVIAQKFGGDISKAPPQALTQIFAPKEVSSTDLATGLKAPIVVPKNPNIVPTSVEGYVPVEARQPAPVQTMPEPVAPQTTQERTDVLLGKAPIESIKTAPNPEVIKGLETELQTAYKNIPEAEKQMNEILVSLELAEPGQRIFLEHDGTRDSNVIAVSSTFPAWIPDGLRTKKSLDALRSLIKDISSITYPTRSNAVGRRLLVDTMLDVLDGRLGVNTKAIRQDILKQYGTIETSNTKVSGGSEQPAGRGELTAKRAEIEAKQAEEKQDQIDRLKREIESGVDFDGPISEKQIAERKAELAKLEEVDNRLTTEKLNKKESKDKEVIYRKGDKVIDDNGDTLTITAGNEPGVDYPEKLKDNNIGFVRVKGKGDEQDYLYYTNRLEKVEKSQKEKVAETIKETPKSIKEISEETKIKEPNIRRILGVGAKEGTFERVDKGVYVLSKGGEDLVWVEANDALESVSRLAKEGFKADMIFLDPPYDLAGNRGGNRMNEKEGTLFETITPEEFGGMMEDFGKILRDENKPIIYMVSQSSSSRKGAERYTKQILDAGFIPVAKGDYFKMTKDGKRFTKPLRPEPLDPEAVYIFNKSGKIDTSQFGDMQFKLVRPKGYKTEKPAELLKQLITMTTNEGDMILDPFAGSGVTGAEAVKAGRKAYLVEKNPEVVEKITKPRVKKAVEEVEVKVIDPFAKLNDAFFKIKNRLEGNNFTREQISGLQAEMRNMSLPEFTKQIRKIIGNMEGDRFASEGLLEILAKAQSIIPKQISGSKPSLNDRNLPKGPSGDASIGNFSDGTPIELGSLDKIRPIEFPELVDLARDLTGNVPFIKKLREKRGLFKDGDIFLNPDIFNTPEQFAKTLAHEIGHLVDYLPEGTLARGNLLGRLKTLQGFMSETFGKEGGVEGPFSKERKNEIKNKITKEVLAENGLKFGDLFGNKLTKEERAVVNKEINTKTRDAVNKVLDKDGFLRNKVIQKELMDVTLYWRPNQKTDVMVDEEGSIIFDEETGKPKMQTITIPLERYPESYQRYRKSSRELYADAISMLFNTPGTLERMAPTFYKEFFNALDRKPAVMNAYFELQELLGGDRDTLLARRRAGVRGMFEKGDMKASDIQKAKMAIKEQKQKDFVFKFKFDFIDKNFGVIDRINKMKKEGKNISDEENPLYYLEERNYLGGKIKSFMEKNIQPVYAKLGDAGISWTDFGEALFYERIASGDRSDVANPRGITPKAAQELRDKMNETLSPEQVKVLEKGILSFREAVKSIAEEAFQEGLYKPEMHDQLMANPAYATFQVLDHMEEGMTSKIHKSMGTLKDVSNPADATLLKTISTLRAIERNKTTRAVVEFLDGNFPKDIKEADYLHTPKGKVPKESKDPELELVTYMKGGRRLGYYVDRYIKESVDNGSISRNNAILDALRIMNSKLFRPLFITYNPGFQAFNFIRDFKRFWKNTPTMTIGRALSLYRKAIPAAKARAWGDITNETIQKMEAEQILSISYNQLTDGADIEAKQIDTILQNSGIDSFQPEVKNRFLKPFYKVLDFVKDMGDFVETLPKVAGYLEFTKGETVELSREQKSFIRKNIGSPDFLAGGYWKPISNEIFLFSNSITQGIRSDFNIATGPTTRSGYWWKTAADNFLPKILMFLASLGFFGSGVKEIMDGASEYDKTNYTIVPLGKDENGKPVYFRVPQDEGGRLLGGILWKAINSTGNKQNFGKDLLDMASFTGGQIPSVTPSITATVATGQFIAGQNPYDWFRNREVLTDDQMKAGGMYSAKPFMGWLFNQSGGGIFYRFTQSAPRDQSATEKLFNFPLVGNIAGRFIRVSDYGKTEEFNQIKEEVQSEQSRRRLDESAVINNYIKEAQKGLSDASIEALVAKNKADLVNDVLGHAPTTKEELTRANNIVKKYQIGLKRGESDPIVNSLISAVTNEEKVTLLTEIRKGITKQEYNKLMLEMLKYKIVSPEVFIKVPNPEKKQ